MSFGHEILISALKDLFSEKKISEIVFLYAILSAVHITKKWCNYGLMSNFTKKIFKSRFSFNQSKISRKLKVKRRIWSTLLIKFCEQLSSKNDILRSSTKITDRALCTTVVGCIVEFCCLIFSSGHDFLYCIMNHICTVRTFSQEWKSFNFPEFQLPANNFLFYNWLSGKSYRFSFQC